MTSLAAPALNSAPAPRVTSPSQLQQEVKATSPESRRLLVDAANDDEAEGDDSSHEADDDEDWSTTGASTAAASHPHHSSQFGRAYTARNLRRPPQSPKARPRDDKRSKSKQKHGDGKDDEDDGFNLCVRWLGRNSGVLWLFTLCQMLIFYDRGMVAGFLPSVQRDVGQLTDTQAGLLGSGFIFGYMLACPLFAFFSKSYSAYKLMALGLALWAVATTACGFAEDFAWLLTARVMTGIGEASFAGLAPTCIDDVAPLAHRTIWLSFFFAGIPLGSALGYVAGGFFGKFGWQYGFLIESVVMLPLVAIVFFWNSDDAKRRSKGKGATATSSSTDDEPNNRRTHFKRTNSWARLQRPQHESYGSTTEQQQAPSSLLHPKPHPALTSQASHFARSISTPGLKRLDDGTMVAMSTAGTEHHSVEVDVQVESVPQPPPELGGSVPPPAHGDTSSFASHDNSRRARTPKALERRYLPSSSHASGYDAAPYQHSIGVRRPLSPDAHLPSPTSFNPHYEAHQAKLQSTKDDNQFLNDIVTLLTDGVYIVVVLGYAALAFVIGALSFWGPVDFSKNLNIGLSRSTRMIGLITFCCGLGGTFFGGWAMDARGGAKGIFAVISALELCCAFTSLSIVFAMVAVSSDDLTLSMTCLALADFFLFATGAPVNASLLSVAPRNMRSLAMAMSILLMHALGDLPSPFLMGLITDAVGSIRLALLCLCAWLLWTVVFWAAGVHLARQRAHAFKQQLQHDMSLPASERSALVARRGSTGAFYASNDALYASIDSRASLQRPYQYYDNAPGSAHQPYTRTDYGSSADEATGRPVSGSSSAHPHSAPRAHRKSRSQANTPHRQQRALSKDRPRDTQPPEEHTPTAAAQV